MKALTIANQRDLSIEDPTNRWLIHPAARLLLPPTLKIGLSANAVSLSGMMFGCLSAFAYYHWQSPGWAVIGLLFSVLWLIADGLDGMVARATRSASAFGRLLDGICDHAVFTAIYLALAFSVDTFSAWCVGMAGGISHFVQSSLYESERARFHRRIAGDGTIPSLPSRSSSTVRAYDWFYHGLDRLGAPFDTALRAATDKAKLAGNYRHEAGKPLRLMVLLTANARVIAIFLACMTGNPLLYWWVEIVPMSLVMVVAIIWHRRIEATLVTQIERR